MEGGTRYTPKLDLPLWAGVDDPEDVDLLLEATAKSLKLIPTA
jgi:hypothetical protein